jgi:hypothetical protein
MSISYPHLSLDKLIDIYIYIKMILIIYYILGSSEDDTISQILTLQVVIDLAPHEAAKVKAEISASLVMIPFGNESIIFFKSALIHPSLPLFCSQPG